MIVRDVYTDIYSLVWIVERKKDKEDDPEIIVRKLIVTWGWIMIKD